MTPNGFFTGCVENRDDPLKLGRCQVRIVGLHTEDKTLLPVADLPWAFPITPITSASVSGVGQSPLGPVEGTWVFITFMDPDCQIPMMLGTLGGVAQIPNATDDPGKLQINNTAPDGTVQSQTDGTGTGETQFGSAASEPPKDGKIVENKDAIVGPLANLIAKAESGSKGYEAFNRGTVNGKIVGANDGGNVTLTKMTIKDIMAKQTLPAGSADRLFAVGKYQCIPVTLASACQALNISHDQCFTPQVQDIICQEYLVGRKRPKLMAYYRNPDKNSETLLKEAGKSLAAEFASIEDPYYPGFPYGGPTGTYHKAGNKVGTKFAEIKSTLVKEWEFRNNPKAPVPTATMGGGDKVAKGTDYSGVSKIKPIDDSVKTAATPSANAPSVGPVNPIPDVVPKIPGLDDLVKATGLSGLSADILAAVGSVQAQFKELAASIDLDGKISDVFGAVKGAQTELLSSFGSTLTEITDNLGISNPTGSVAGLINELGIAKPSPEALAEELAKRAGSAQGQAKAMLAKLDNEPTKEQSVPVGQKNPDGSISTGSTVDPTKGFQDPNGTYPKYKGEQDTNRLASGNNLGRTIVLQKEADLKTGIKIANGGTWDQSPNPYNAKYPFNHVTQTESGHIVEYDDTPGSERINIHHKAGTFTEIDANGTQVNKIIGDGFEIVERNGFVYVKGAYTVTVDGAMNLMTDNVFNLEVSGAANIKIYNNANIEVSGNANMGVGGAFSVKAAQINMESEGQFNIKAKTGLNIDAGSDLNFRTEGSAYLEADGNYNIKSAGTAYIEAEGDLNLKSAGLINSESADETNIKSGANTNISADSDMNIKGGGDTNVEAGGQASVLAGGAVAIDGSSVELADGQSNSASEAGGATAATPANKATVVEIELPVETRTGSGTTFLPPLSVVTRGIETPYENNDPKDAKAFSAYRSARVANNEASSTNIGDQKYVQDSSKPTATSSTSGTPVDVSAILKMDPAAFNAGMRLSKNWTLGELTANGTRIPRQTYTVQNSNQDKTTRQLTAQQIVANLMGVAENILEPLTEKYGKGSFRITSAFRRPAVGNQMGDLGRPDWGDHPNGCAVDICFVGGKVKNFEICKELPKVLKSWNQLIMEYDNPTEQKGHWIHISYRQAGGNQGHCFSMNNHRMCVAGVNAGFVLV